MDLELGTYVEEEPSTGHHHHHHDEAPVQLPKYKATIIATETREEEPENQSVFSDNKFTVYEIKVVNQNDGQFHYVFRRFNEFAALKKYLAEKYPEKTVEAEKLNNIFPSGTWFWTNKLSKEVIENRKEHLNELLQYICGDDVYSGDERFYEFLQCDMKMLEKALSFFRSKLYNYQQSRKDIKEKDEYERSQAMVRQLTRKRSESLNKMKEHK